MKENLIKFLYAIDCYLLYVLSGVVSSLLVVGYYSVVAAHDFAGIDATSFFEYIETVLADKSSVVLLVSYVLVLGVAALICALKKIRFSSYTGLSYGRPASVLSSAALGVLLNFAISSLLPSDVSGTGEILSVVLILCIVLGPFVEELMFRGVLLKMFGASVGVFFSIVITSALFAISHGDALQIAYTFVLGLILAVVRYKSTSLWSAVALHMSFNIAGAVSGYFGLSFDGVELAVILAASVVLFVIACTGGRKLSPKRKEDEPA